MYWRARAAKFALALFSCPACLVSVACAASGCNAPTVADRSRFVEDGVSASAMTDWTGEKFVVENAGVSEGGGLALSTNPEATRVTAVARMLAVCDTQDKSSADRAIDDAKKGFQDVATNAGVTTLDCGHGAATGSVASADSGCDAVDVSLPAGTAAKPLFATVRSGRGKVRATLHPASFVGSFELRGSHGPIDVTFPATRGATITIVAETGDDMIVHLPADFAADVLTLETSGDKIDVGAFPEVQSGKGRGVAGQGAKSMTLRTTGRITLARD